MNDEVLVYTAMGEADAQQVRAFLEAYGISCEFRGEALRVTHGFTMDGLGEVRIYVARDQAPEAQRLLQRVQSGELALDVPEEDANG